jgi:hypothetical protein
MYEPSEDFVTHHFSTQWPQIFIPPWNKGNYRGVKIYRRRRHQQRKNDSVCTSLRGCQDMKIASWQTGTVWRVTHPRTTHPSRPRCTFLCVFPSWNSRNRQRHQIFWLLSTQRGGPGQLLVSAQHVSSIKRSDKVSRTIILYKEAP